jgi:chaperonin GroEL
MKKHFSSNEELHEKFLNGINKLADIVSSTLGPKGTNVVLRATDGAPVVTKDGVTIANFISFEDPFEDVAAQIIKQAAAKTAEEAGDGTTTSTVLARVLIHKAHKYIKAGLSTTQLKNGMEKALYDIVEYLRSNSKQVSSIDDVRHVATISANGDEAIGEMIATAVDKVGMDGVVNIEPSRSNQTIVDIAEGFSFNSGYVANAFVTEDRKQTANYNNCLLFITDHKLASVEPVLPILELAARENRPLIIVAEEIEGQLLASLIMNTVRGSMKIVGIKAPFYGEERRSLLKDLAHVTGAKFMSRDSGVSFDQFTLADFGKAENIEVKKNQTIVVGGNSSYDAIEETMVSLKKQIKETEELEECELIQQRINRLAGGVAIIKVGGNTDVEMRERRHRIEDALEAVLAAQAAGIHAGGGIALLDASVRVKRQRLKGDEKIGYDIVFESLDEPLKQMAYNAALSPDLVVAKAVRLSKGYGVDLIKNKKVDMMKEGIIDPVQVTCCALKNAVSVAGAILTTKHAVLGV